MNIFTPEKLRELAYDVVACETRFGEDKVITKWLEQNQPEPVVVGLSDEQIISLNGKLHAAQERYDDFGIIDIKQWLESQTFTQREPVVVGLTVDQVIILGEAIRSRPNESETLVIHDWLKTQTYDDTYEEKYLELYDDYQSLIVDKMLVEKELEQLKSQSQPNWDDAPEWANWLAQDSYGKWIWFERKPTVNNVSWFDNGGQREAINANINWQQTLQERPKPTPAVEVGQVWQTACLNKFEISSIGEYCDEDNVTSPSVTYSDIDNGRVYVRLMSDFLAKFIRVQP